MKGEEDDHLSRRTHLSRALASADQKAQYDAYVKEILSDREILARILKGVADEFRDYEVKEILPCIDTPFVAEIPVAPGLTGKALTEKALSEKELTEKAVSGPAGAGRQGAKISGMNTDDPVGNEGHDTFDIRFSAVTPSGSGRVQVKIIINVEAQKDYHPGYDLVTRGVFYAARNISSQLDVEFPPGEYDGLCKVYSIWVCMSVPDKYADTITLYELKPRDLYGHYTGTSRYDLMTVVMIRLGNLKSKNSLIRLLDTLLTDQLGTAEKENILEQDFDIARDEERREDLKDMCNLSEGIYQQGMREGILESLRNLIRSLDLSAPDAMNALGIPSEEREYYLSQLQS